MAANACGSIGARGAGFTAGAGFGCCCSSGGGAAITDALYLAVIDVMSRQPMVVSSFVQRISYACVDR